MAIDPKVFRSALGRFATGVTVVTVKDGGAAHGMTANAFSSVSLDPPLVLVCVDHKANSLDLIRRSGRFAINFLAEEQKGLSDWFAGKGRDAADQFASVPHEAGENGSPILKGHIGALECGLHEEYAGGDHSIFLGRVTRVLLPEEVRAPLLFYASAYRKMNMGAAFDR
jgi:flavin reductase (DIM6/NTAB) family NADH-FMN oxidoreductase RutF